MTTIPISFEIAGWEEQVSRPQHCWRAGRMLIQLPQRNKKKKVLVLVGRVLGPTRCIYASDHS